MQLQFHLDDEAVRTAVGLHLGGDICKPHLCVCGELVDVRGSHALSVNETVEELFATIILMTLSIVA